MRLSRTFRILIGLLLWAGAIYWCSLLVTEKRRTRDPSGQRSVLADIEDHVTRRTITYDLSFPQPVLLEVGDDVLGTSELDVLGEVAVLLDDAGRPLASTYGRTRRARIVLFDRAASPVHADASARLVRVPDLAGGWVVRTLITEEKAERIREIWTERGLLLHRKELIELATPIFEQVIADCQKTIEEEARPFFRRHRSAVDELLRQVEADLGKDKMAQLFEEEVWPSLQIHLRPVLDEVGEEIWEKLPLWSFGWRIVYQSLPLTADDHFERRWNRFLERKIVPILKSHSGDIIEVSRKVAKETLANPRVIAVIRDAAKNLLSDPRSHRLTWAFIDEVFLKNPRFRERMRSRWESRSVQDFVNQVSSWLEPVVREIGDVVLGTKEEGITPEFARVLRAQLLEKDARRVWLASGSSEKARLPAGATISAVEREEGP